MSDSDVSDVGVSAAGWDAEPSPEEQALAQEVLSTLSTRLERLAETLPPEEREALDVILFRAMTPLERMRVLGEAGALDDDERALLEEIEATERA